MKFSEQWLREWVDLKVSTEELADQLTMAGLEVDAMEPAAPAFEGVVVGEVVEVQPHPDADKLRVCKVAVGGEEPLDIVCGAPNVYEGMRAPTAQVGGVLPGGLKIKKAKLRGVPSQGMLCSAKELGLAENAEGLMDLPQDAPVGTDLRDYLGLDDVTIELGLTPNRGDCLSMRGIAREAAALNETAASGPEMAPVATVHDETFQVQVEAPADCPRYVGRVIKGVDNRAATPVWMQERLRRSGIRSLGPLVDVTNYVLLELGQPMHAFDLQRLSGPITVRRAGAGERLTLLDGRELELDGESLVIADASGAQALAGVMGGAATACDDDTRDIFLESAFFNPTTVAGRARSFGLHTDSSHRFERGVDPDLQRLAVERATALLLEVAGGEPGPVTEVCDEARLPARPTIPLRADRLARVLGTEVDADEVTGILERLGMAVEAADGRWRVTSPPFRFDVAIEEDLIEEIGRVHGYEKIPSTLPEVRLETTAEPEARASTGHLRRALVERGYQEAITYTFVDPELQGRLDPEREGLRLANPIASDMSVMRTTVWPGLIQAQRHNLNRQQERVRLFETGLVFLPEGEGLRQEGVIGGIVCGEVLPEQWGAPAQLVDFFDVKGDLEALLEAGGGADAFAFAADRHPALHPGQTARIERDGEPAGWLGRLHPALAGELEVPEGTFLFQLRLAPVATGAIPRFEELSRFQANRRDLAMVVDRSVPAARVLESARRAAPAIVREAELFDVYEGKGIEPGRKSLAIRLTLQENSRTLTDSEVDAAVSDVVAALGDELGATLRN